MISEGSFVGRRGVLTSTASLLLAIRQAHAAVGFAERPLRLVISSAAGASLNTLARTLAPALGARLGQSVVIENQSGGLGVVAISQVARSAADGTTLLVIGDAIVLTDALLPDTGYSIQTSFAPVTQAIRAAQIVVTLPQSHAKRSGLRGSRARPPRATERGSAGMGRHRSSAQ